MQVLITAGGTEEPIDGVRYITNFSTGRTGALLADTLSEAGFKVTLLTSRRAILPKSNVKVEHYGSFADLKSKLEKELKEKYNVVLHAAAVSDYSVDYLESDGKKIIPDEDLKLDSSKPLKIVLKNNIKLVNRLKEYSSNTIRVIAFKLTKNASNELIKDKVSRIFNGGEVDFVVHNDLTSITTNSHKTTIYSPNGAIYTGETKEELGKNIIKLLREVD